MNESFKYTKNTTNTTMNDVTVSVKVDSTIHEHMKLHDEINWSGVLRKAIDEQIEKLHTVDKKKVDSALTRIKKIREAHAFDHGRPSLEILKEWRRKRK